MRKTYLYVSLYFVVGLIVSVIMSLYFYDLTGFEHTAQQEENRRLFVIFSTFAWPFIVGILILSIVFRFLIELGAS